MEYVHFPTTHTHTAAAAAAADIPSPGQPHIRLLSNGSPVPLSPTCKNMNPAFGSHTLADFVSSNEASRKLVWYGDIWNATCGSWDLRSRLTSERMQVPSTISYIIISAVTTHKKKKVRFFFLPKNHKYNAHLFSILAIRLRLRQKQQGHDETIIGRFRL